MTNKTKSVAEDKMVYLDAKEVIQHWKKGDLVIHTVLAGFLLNNQPGDVPAFCYGGHYRNRWINVPDVWCINASGDEVEDKVIVIDTLNWSSNPACIMPEEIALLSGLLDGLCGCQDECEFVRLDTSKGEGVVKFKTE